MTDKTVPAFEFIDVADEAVNPYIDMVQALDAAGEGKGYPLTTPTDEHEKALRQVRAAAHTIDKTARRKGATKVDGDNSTTVVTLRPRVVRGEGEPEGDELADDTAAE